MENLALGFISSTRSITTAHLVQEVESVCERI